MPRIRIDALKENMRPVVVQNEPHTRDLYEKNRGMPAGQLVKNWLREMSAWLKGLDSNHLISSGEEGYRAGGPTESQGSVGANSWINGGYKGQASTP